jgi:hypothetical protein
VYSPDAQSLSTAFPTRAPGQGADVTSRDERVAANEAVFRDANELIRLHAGKLALERSEEAPFLCECADPACTEVIQLTLGDYETVRASSNTFLIVPGHDAPASETVVDAGTASPGVAVVEKKKPGQEITERTDPRR